MRRSLLTTLTVVCGSLATVAGALGDGFPARPGFVMGWSGVVGPHGLIRYVAIPADGGTTMVVGARTKDGRVVRWSGLLRGAFGVPLVSDDGLADGVSANNRVLVLETGTVFGVDNPSGTTRFAVVRLPRLRAVKLIDLNGIWSFDAVSPDGETIFAIEYSSTASAQSSRYRVRAIDVSQGRARPGAIVDPREPSESMTGEPLTRAYGPGGRWAYTLYMRPNGTAFVHALDTVHARARCIDLPWRAVSDPYALRIAVPPTGESIAIRQHGRVVASIDLRSLRVRLLGAVS